MFKCSVCGEFFKGGQPYLLCESCLRQTAETARRQLLDGTVSMACLIEGFNGVQSLVLNEYIMEILKERIHDGKFTLRQNS